MTAKSRLKPDVIIRGQIAMGFSCNYYSIIWGIYSLISSNKTINLHYMPMKGEIVKDLTKLIVVLAEQKKTGKWLAEQFGKDISTVSKWRSNNSMQLSLEVLMRQKKNLLN